IKPKAVPMARAIIIFIMFEDDIREIINYFASEYGDLRNARLIKKYLSRLLTAPEDACLPLLPFGPGGVHKVSPRQTCPDGRKDTRMNEVCQFIFLLQSSQEKYQRAVLQTKFQLFRASRQSLGHEVIFFYRVYHSIMHP